MQTILYHSIIHSHLCTGKTAEAQLMVGDPDVNINNLDEVSFRKITLTRNQKFNYKEIIQCKGYSCLRYNHYLD